MSPAKEESPTLHEEEAPDAGIDVAEQEEQPAEEEHRLSLTAEIQDAGPCRKHVRIRIPREEISHYYGEEVEELSSSAEVPGFRKGRVPKRLVEKRFRQELSDQVKQKLLLESLEQVAEQYDIDPINEPDLDVGTIDLPEEGDFEYEFEVEVRPDFELPDYAGLTITRPAREITDADVESYLERFLAQFGEYEPREGTAEPGDHLTLAVQFQHNGRTLHKLHELRAQLRPVLRFRDAELEGFDQLLVGSKAGDVRETDLAVSQEAETIEMRGETVKARFTVKDVRRLKLPELNKEFLQRIGVESEDEVRNEIRNTLDRQVKYKQRQAVREQVLEKITESADWELPESLVLKQVENALRREILEMQQAGFTAQEIRSRENEIRQGAVTTTRRALKEHFVLDKIATEENIEVESQDIETEILMMALQQGESPRRLRARLEKSGMIENLAAQIRERKAVDVVLEKAKFKDVPMEPPVESRVEAVAHYVCGIPAGAEVSRAEEEVPEA